jgi:hypothetical protein
MEIFSQKTLFVYNSYLGSFKQPLDQRCCNEKSLSMLVSMKNCFWPLQNQCSGSSGPNEWARSLKEIIDETEIGKILCLISYDFVESRSIFNGTKIMITVLETEHFQLSGNLQSFKTCIFFGPVLSTW